MSYQNEDIREFGWDDEIENDGEDFITLEPGNYEFTVTGFERKRYEGSANIPPCNMAELKIRVSDPVQGSTTVTERLFLLSKFEWKLCQFFTAIGQRKKGEKLRPRWGEVLGAKGMCAVVINHYTDKNGNEKQNNRIDKWLEPAEPAKAFVPGEF